ncbi:thioredoxin family protein [Paenibacillus segetis]|uniref:Thiol reductase thioredoxin n=1 Tax=Paenibacillus segetis TaxID=1325360 RepID=A0ABQ1YUT3_9BACL|nr:thioredoxin family protein [Paenibacillus segetis]GGH37329.1 thiol reductase thioredoxin [Paenibacillus segetis]
MNDITIPEITESEWINRPQQEKPSGDKEALFFFTPFCGTCKLTEKMLNIVLETGTIIPVSKININYAPFLRDSWKISSVPCLVILQDGNPIEIQYAMSSVVDLHRFLQG